MHMADALISPAVGGTLWAAAAGLTVYSARKLKDGLDDSKVPLMGVLGAFVFAAQMINFTIPGTGSSGHLGGGMLLAILLGPYAAFLTMASILTVQALFFADGGLLALGCNLFNLGFFTCFVAYPLVYKRLVGAQPSRRRILLSAMTASVLGLQMGACGVVLESLFSGISDLPFATFALLMQPIHLGIGMVEGLVTSAVVSFVWSSRPEVLEAHSVPGTGQRPAIKNVIVGFLLAAVVTGGVLSWFASTRPDGLEWAMHHSSGKEELEAPKQGLHGLLAFIQEKTAFLPDYGFKENQQEERGQPGHQEPSGKSAKEEGWPAASAGTSASGLIGGAMTLILVVLIGLALRRHRRRT